MADSTIFAPATAPGRAGVAILRISGPRARAVWPALGVPLPRPRVATRARFGGIDHGIALWFPGPASFTGEDVAELQIHGSRAVIKALCSRLGALPGFRLAEPGEFARRAFFNGKLDLAEVEGLADLIDAETEAQRVQALRLLEGADSARYEGLRARLMAALAHLEATIDFSDEDIPPSLWENVRAEVRALSGDIAALLADGERGERIREGISVVILGAPNAGKSSLLNALARRDAAMVSQLAGTTRDLIEVHLDIGGFPVVLVDTAGLRDSEDPLEQEGIRRARARAAGADLKLLVFAQGVEDAATSSLADGNALLIASKADLAGPPLPPGLLAVSAHSGLGMEELLRRLEEKIRRRFDGAGSGAAIARARHREALVEAQRHLTAFFEVTETELACEELRLSARALGKITGVIGVDELLDRIFREFCIGK